MRSPAGWALANVWYDTYQGTPPRGSPLETLFVLVYLDRRKAELLATQSLVRAQFSLLTKSPDSAKAAFESYQRYADSMFPFLAQAGETSVDDHSRLLEFVRSPMQIDVRAVEHDRAQTARAKGLRRFKLKER